MLRQLSLALRQIGSQQANALEEVREKRREETFFISWELRESKPVILFFAALP